MKGLKVIVLRKNEAREKRIKELEAIVSQRYPSTYELERLRNELDRDYPETITEECVIMYNDTTKAVVQCISDGTLHVVDIEGLKVVHNLAKEE